MTARGDSRAVPAAGCPVRRPERSWQQVVRPHAEEVQRAPPAARAGTRPTAPRSWLPTGIPRSNTTPAPASRACSSAITPRTQVTSSRHETIGIITCRAARAPTPGRARGSAAEQPLELLVDAHRAVAEERVVLLRQREVRERLVAADVQRPDDDGPAAGLATARAYRRTARPRTAPPCGRGRASRSGRGRCPRRRRPSPARRLGRRADVRPDLDPPAVLGRGRAREKPSRARGAAPAGAAPCRSSAARHRSARSPRLPRSRVDDDLRPSTRPRPAGDADHRRDAVRPGQDDGVRRRAAVGEDQALDEPAVEREQLPGRHRVRHAHRVLGQRRSRSDAAPPRYASPSRRRQTSRMSSARSSSSALPVAASIALNCGSGLGDGAGRRQPRSRIARTMAWLNSGSRATDRCARSTSAFDPSARASSHCVGPAEQPAERPFDPPISASTSVTPVSAIESGSANPPIARARPMPMPAATACPASPSHSPAAARAAAAPRPACARRRRTASSTCGSVCSMKTLSDSTAHAASRPTAAIEQGSPWRMSRPTMPRTLLALAVWPVRSLASDDVRREPAGDVLERAGRARVHPVRRAGR